MQTEPGGGVSESVSFAHTLETLKREGSNILIVGSGAPTAHESVCQRLLGEVTNAPRYRLLVVIGKTRYSGHDCTQQCEKPNTYVITHGGTKPSDDDSETVADPIGGLGSAVIETLHECELDAGGLEPAELRFCMESLVPLLSEYDPEAVFRLIHMTTTGVKTVNGMGHYHLPLDSDHDAVNLLEPLFDATVEVRTRGDQQQQRWHLREHESPSEWLEL